MSVLSGYKVLDLAVGTAGPIVGMFLSDFGAEVVKVEPPEGDFARKQAGFAAYNRGKKGITLDPGQQSDADRFLQLVAAADVLIVNRDEDLLPYGTDIARLSQQHKSLIIVEVPPYVRGFTPWSGGQESAGLVAAILGQSSRQSSSDGTPVESVYPTVLYVHGLWAATCAIAALIERETSGFGQIVSVSAVNAMQQMGLYSITSDPDAPDPFTGMGSGGPHPTYRPVETKDGKWLISGALGGKFEPMVLHLIGAADILEDPRVNGNFWNVFRDPKLLLEVHRRVRAGFLTRDAEEWLKIFVEAGIPCGIVGQREEWLDHPQVRAAGLRLEVNDPERGQVVMPGVPFALTRTPAAVTVGAPTLGQHNDEDLSWQPKTAPKGNAPLRPGPLHGYTILNLGTFVATPYAGALLAELGANVVKVEAAGTGDPFRVPGFAVNRGMASLSLDLKEGDGLSTFYDVVRNADVVLDGLRPGVTKRLGIDYDALRVINPEVITVSLSGFGEDGPLSDQAAVDMVLQGMAGMMSAEGGDTDPVANTIAVIDMTTAVFNALASIMALLHKVRSGGEGQRVWTSLLGSATYLQLNEITWFERRGASPVGAANYKGPSPFDRIYKTADGWLRVQAAQEVAHDFYQALGIATPVGDSAVPINEIEAAVASRLTDDLVIALNARGLPSVPVRSINQVVRDPRLSLDEFVTVRQADDGAFIVEPTRLASFSRTRRFGARLPPGIGQHTIEVLMRAGLTKERIAELENRGVVTCGKPMAQAIGVSYR